jgi:hypothetical protein
MTFIHSLLELLFTTIASMIQDNKTAIDIDLLSV